ncbi:ferric-dicitrate binding protein FerR (iron transport regulator) [Algoriphagus sp. 4150]|uniref:FecR family protein n=1 Tax=Algoriphagus sp. 4150 TaxID=2817756 RepID=UPI00285A9D83|nr:FecR domain-containing protein [Algoriphagus sp. 4150]MDR7129456.1 ferric-dicitrate binding protein FerR (iron transport regulator) [Algoriphagus sp. 4150]
MSPELIKKFFDGRCTPEEVHQVLLWITSEKGRGDLEKHFENFQEESNRLAVDSKAMFDKIHKRIEEENKPSISRVGGGACDRSTSKSKSFMSWKARIAASILICLLTSVVWLLFPGNEEEKKQTAKSGQIHYETRQTMAGEKLTLKLNDGTMIRLNANSKIRFPKSFSEAKREVYLQGEAFFDVYRNEESPFIVYSTGLKTSVLGTSFAVSEDSAKQSSQVAVLTGSVKVSKSENSSSSENEEILLHTMDAAIFEGDGALQKMKIDYDQAFAWKDNVIVFQNANFGEVLDRLENWFGVHFKVNRKLKGSKDYSGRFEHQTLEEILIGLSFTFDFEFKIEDSTIIIN